MTGASTLSLALLIGFVPSAFSYAQSETPLVDNVLGFYEVPTNSTVLKPLYTMTLMDYQLVKTDKGQIIMRYQLPRDLTGYDTIFIEQTYQGDNVQHQKMFSSKEAITICDGSWKVLNCSMKLNAFQPDRDLVDSYLDIRYGNDLKLLGLKRDMSTFFRGEPMGIVHSIDPAACVLLPTGWTCPSK